MSKIRLATNKKSCHTLLAAKLTQHDVSTILIYYMGASEISEAFLKKTRTAITEATRNCCLLGNHVARERICGPPQRDGTGIIDPRA